MGSYEQDKNSLISVTDTQAAQIEQKKNWLNQVRASLVAASNAYQAQMTQINAVANGISVEQNKLNQASSIYKKWEQDSIASTVKNAELEDVIDECEYKLNLFDFDDPIEVETRFGEVTAELDTLESYIFQYQQLGLAVVKARADKKKEKEAEIAYERQRELAILNRPKTTFGDSDDAYIPQGTNGQAFKPVVQVKNKYMDL